MSEKLVYIISDIDKALAFEWTALHLHKKYNLIYVLIGKKGSALERYVVDEIGIKCIIISDDDYPGFARKWIRLFVVLWNENPAIVHTHLWRANLLGLTTSWVLRVKKRIFTRHHATIHYDQYPSGRKWDKLCNALATHIISISVSISDILIQRDNAPPDKINLIHHGFDFDYFQVSDKARVETLRVKYNIPEGTFPVVGAISRFVEWKGVQYILPAFKQLLRKYPNAKLMLANARGDYEDQLKTMIQDLPSQSCVTIGFESDLSALYRLFDVFVHVPVSSSAEAFGQTYIESLSCQVPSVFTMSGIAQEFIVHKQNAWVVDFKNSEQITDGIEHILMDKNFSALLKQNGLHAVQQFSLSQYLLSLQDLYTKEV